MTNLAKNVKKIKKCSSLVFALLLAHSLAQRKVTQLNRIITWLKIKFVYSDVWSTKI